TLAPPATAAATASLAAPLPFAAATRGGTSTPFESWATSICPRPASTRWPASVQKNVAPARPRKLRRAVGPGPPGGLLPPRHRHLHLRRVDRADELVGAGGRKGVRELGVGHRRRLGRVRALLLQPLGPRLQMDVVWFDVGRGPHPLDLAALLDLHRA